MKLPSFLLSLALFSGLSAMDSPVDLMDAAISQFKARDIESALKAASAAKVALFQMAPLYLEAFQLEQKPAMAYGVYLPRDSNVYAEGEEIHIYCEPTGYTFQMEEGKYRFSLTTDFILVDQENRVLAREENFSCFHLDSHEPNTEVMLNITYQFAGMKPGKYSLITTVKDAYSGKTATATLPVVFK